MMIHKNTSTCYYIIYGYNYHNGAKFHMEWIFADLKYTRKKSNTAYKLFILLKVKMIKGGTFKEFTRNIRTFSSLELELVKDNENNSSVIENLP